jgi:hypothetical protein
MKDPWKANKVVEHVLAETKFEEGKTSTETELETEAAPPLQLTTSEALVKAASMSSLVPPLDSAERTAETNDTTIPAITDGMTYCPECYLPLHPDPKPERLYIFLHALRYTTSLGCFETEMPGWAAEGWEWDRS